MLPLIVLIGCYLAPATWTLPQRADAGVWRRPVESQLLFQEHQPQFALSAPVSSQDGHDMHPPNLRLETHFFLTDLPTGATPIRASLKSELPSISAVFPLCPFDPSINYLRF